MSMVLSLLLLLPSVFLFMLMLIIRMTCVLSFPSMSSPLLSMLLCVDVIYVVVVVSGVYYAVVVYVIASVIVYDVVYVVVAAVVNVDVIINVVVVHFVDDVVNCVVVWCCFVFVIHIVHAVTDIY